MQGTAKAAVWIVLPVLTAAIGFGVVMLFVGFGQSLSQQNAAETGVADASASGDPSAIAAASEQSATDEAAPDGVPESLSSFRLANFDLTDQDGSAVGEDLFDGRVTVLAFFFTNCPGPCPLITREMASIQQRTRGTGLRLASISVDGDRDTPAVLRSYAVNNGADEGRWRFLTGDPALVKRLAEDSLNFEIREQPEFLVTRGDGSQMPNILHPTRLLLLGPDRTLIGVYPYNDEDAVNRLVADALTALS
ncbi:MAG: SCO family protein [Planctomycetota bacterium]